MGDIGLIIAYIITYIVVSAYGILEVKAWLDADKGEEDKGEEEDEIENH